MATIKISELEEVTELSSSDVLPIINENETKKVSIEKLNEILGGDIGIQVMEIPGGLKSDSSNGAPGSYNTDATTCALLSTYINKCKGGYLQPLILIYGPNLELAGLFSPIIGSSVVGTATSRYFLNSELRNTKNSDIVANTGNITYKYDRISFFINGSWANGIFTCTGYCVHNQTINEMTTGYVINNTLTRTNTQEYTPTEDYHPATKKYVDEIATGGANVDLTNYYTKDEVQTVITENVPGSKIYVAKDVYSLTNASPNNISGTSTAGQNIIAAVQKAYDNGDYTFRLRMCASDPTLIPQYIDAILTLPESGSGSITEQNVRTYVFSDLTPRDIKYYYNSHRLKMTDGQVVTSSTGGSATGIYYGSYQFVLSSTLSDYVKTTDMNTALEAKQDTLTAGDNITIVDNVISATGGGSGGTVIPETVHFISSNCVTIGQDNTDATVCAQLSEILTTVYQYYGNANGTYSIIWTDKSGYVNTMFTMEPGAFARLIGKSLQMVVFDMMYKTLQLKITYTKDDDGVHTVSKFNISETSVPEIVGDPIGDTYATNKKYVDDAITTAITTVLEAEY